jgi:carboxymethylenebutenolidase
MSVPGAVTDPDALETRELRYIGHGTDGVHAYFAVRGDAVTEGEVVPGVIVVHEAFGLNEHIRDVARRFAAIGYHAIAPDLYSREGAPPADDMDAVIAAMTKMPDERVVGDLVGAAGLLREQPGANGQVACVGFCSGGRQTLLAACSSTALDAAVCCWGGRIASTEKSPERPVPVIRMVKNLACPLLLVGGADDENPSPGHLRQVLEEAEASGQDVELEIYPDAGHAFFADHRPDKYRAAAAHALWPRMTSFLTERLHVA